MLGATTAGMAFSNASVALVHGMSRPIGAFFHVPHGLSNAMLLPEITAFSAPAALERYADCARAMGIAEEGEGSQAAVARLLDELRRLNEDLQVPTPRAWGIDAGALRGVAAGDGEPGARLGFARRTTRGCRRAMKLSSSTAASTADYRSDAIEVTVALAETEIGDVAEAGGLAMGGARLLRELRGFVDPIQAAVAHRHRRRRALHDCHARTCGDRQTEECNEA